MDSMGLQGAQRLAMKNMPLEGKQQLLHTHRLTQDRAAESQTPLSDHLGILSRAGTQSLPCARLEKLRVDVSCQSIQQINAFVDDGGLRLLLQHLAQLNARRAARRADELMKEHELLRCVLGVAKVDAGAAYLLDGVRLRHVLDSVATRWLPCATVALRIVSMLVQRRAAHEVILAALFRRESEGAEPGVKRKLPFAEWMDAVERAMDEYDADAPTAERQTAAAHAVDFVAASLTLVNGALDLVCSSSIDRRVKLYDRLAAHDMLRKFAALRAWRLAIVDAHLDRWDRALRRDYNIARSQVRRDSVVLEDNGSAVRDVALFASFVARYEDVRGERAGESGEDNDDEYLRMGLATCETPKVAASAPATPGATRALATAPVAPSTNPFFAAAATPSAALDEPELPFMPRTRSHSNQVAETGSLRDLRAKPAAPAAMPSDPASALASLRAIGLQLAKLSADLQRLSVPADADEAARELHAIAQVAHNTLAAISPPH
ncbi:hypothetical protein GGI05_003710 [Coemansia sp. RSA 2603]|nr:hypothetical protein GGI05_003710 [Coemansia sp. RSA 2603]